MHIRFWWDARRKETTRKTWTKGEDNIKIDLKGIGLGVMDWIYLARERDELWAIVNTVMNLWVP
jgi:hypothetical protein